jgi:hypothetical protein
MRLIHKLILFVGALALSQPAFAVDGVLEINQTCAVQTGCFAGDTTGFPVTIDGGVGKSYRLTSNLVVPNDDATGIEARATEVQIDLNGFAIVRSGCEIDSRICTATDGNGRGIRSRLGPAAQFSGLVVTNGSIVGMGAHGVEAASHAEIRGINSVANGADGIFVGSGSIVANNRVSSNVGAGISASNGGMISGNVMISNEVGLSIGPDGTYRENAITANVAGAVTGGGVNLGGNYCAGPNVISATCP